jgi:hypothetical protein
MRITAKVAYADGPKPAAVPAQSALAEPSEPPVRSPPGGAPPATVQGELALAESGLTDPDEIRDRREPDQPGSQASEGPDDLVS